jgi:ABC-type Zn uptake system ZnuABC Zn-binding protein ZnuA
MKPRSLFLPVVVMAVGAGLVAGGCTSGVSDGWPDRPGPKVVASFAPIECFAKNMAGDDAVVRAMMTTQGPHEYSAGPADARMVGRADLLFVNGLMLDEREAKKMADGSGNKALRFVNLGSKLPDALLLEMGDHDGDEHDKGGHKHEGHKHDHQHGAHDPHIWMGLPQAVKMVEGIRDELKGFDPTHAADYNRRAAEYVAKLNAIKADGEKLLKDKKDRKFVSFHESLGYFAKTFDLEIAAVIEDVPGSEPTPQQLQEIVAKCVQHKVRVIAVEPQYTAKTAADQILKELKAKGIADPKLVVIDPMETATDAEMNVGWYETKMRANLAALAEALK